MPPLPAWTERAARDRVGFWPAYQRARNRGAAAPRAREIALEAVQEAHCRAQRPTQQFCSEGYFRAWLCRVAANLVTDYFRQEWPLRQAAGDDFAAPCAGDADQDEAVRWALGQLDEKDRELISRYYFEGSNYRQIAAEHRRSTTWAYERVRAALSRLRGFLATQGLGQ